MPVFDLDQAFIAVSDAGAGTTTNTYTEATFTFSIGVVNGDGSNIADVRTTLGGLYLDNNGLGGTNVDQFTFDPDGAGFSQFSGDVTISVGVESNAWLANGQALVTGNNVLSGAGGSIVFTSANPGQSAALLISSITANLNCFCVGTLIATPDGPRAIEDLVAGDQILTADGDESQVRWLGQQKVHAEYLHPKKVNPICIQAGALGPDLPQRDLYLSGDHAIALDGLLINANALVNGTSIFQVPDMPLDGFTYYHVETDAHELLVAEGVGAETYLEAVSTAVFDNLSTRPKTNSLMAEMPLPRISSARLLPQSIRHALGISLSQAA